MKARTMSWIAAAVLAVGATGSAAAQAWNYPSMHHPHIMQRELNVGLASGQGTVLFGQWREGIAEGTELGFEAGIADPDGGDTRLLIGGGVAMRVAEATTTMPLDILVTAGAYPSFGDPVNFLRVPFGATLGRRIGFPQSELAITPYVHPRVSLDFCLGDDDECGGDKSDIAINFDLGADFELNRQLSLRFSLLFPGGDYFDDTAFGLSLAWKPAAAR